MVKYFLYASVALMLPVLSSCGDSGKPKVKTTVHFFHGPKTSESPTANADMTIAATPAMPANGGWSLTPNKMVITATNIQFKGSQRNKVECNIPYSSANPNMAPLMDCIIPLETGIYTGLTIGFSPTFYVLIDDAKNGFFSTPTGIVTTAPAGGAQLLPINTEDPSVNKIINFDTPLKVVKGTPVEISVIIQRSYSLPVTVTNGNVALGGQEGKPVTIPEMVITAN